LETPTWNRNPLQEVYPWGTIRKASPAANKMTAEELSGEEIDRIRVWADHYLEVFNYTTFI
ncbi:MAG: sulfotransferase, partial [Bacteroidetes bacterium]|nr:sulfotransferase [Bacteroidota bacterium]